MQLKRILLFVTLSLLFSLSYAEVIHLRDGGEIEGKIVGKDEEGIRVQTSYGTFYLKWGKLTREEVVRLKGKKIDKRRGELSYERAVKLELEDKVKEALREYRKAIDADPTEKDYGEALGCLSDEKKKHQEIAKLTEEVSSLRRRGEKKLEVAKTYARRASGGTSASARSASEAEVARKLADFRRRLADKAEPLRKEGEKLLKEADKRKEKLKELRGKTGKAYQERADVYFKEKRYRKALLELHRLKRGEFSCPDLEGKMLGAVAILGKSDTHFRKARSLIKEGKYAEAEKELSASLEIWPGNRKARWAFELGWPGLKL